MQTRRKRSRYIPKVITPKGKDIRPVASPWKPLGLEIILDGGHRVRQIEAELPLMSRAGYGRLSKFWATPLMGCAAAIFHGTPKAATAIIDHAAKYVSTIIPQTAEMYSYDLTEDRKYHESLEDIHQRNNYFTNIEYGGGYKQFFVDLIDYADEVEETSEQMGYIQPPNKKFQFICVMLDNNHIEELFDDTEYLGDFYAAMTTMKNQRIYPIIFSPDATRMPINILKDFECQVFLGKKNDDYARSEVHPKSVAVRHNLKKTYVGIGYNGSFDEKLVPLSPPVFEKSVYVKTVEESRKVEEDSYREFIENLKRKSDFYDKQ